MSEFYLEIKWIILRFFVFQDYVLLNCIIGMRFSVFCQDKVRELGFYFSKNVGIGNVIYIYSNDLEYEK